MTSLRAADARSDHTTTFTSMASRVTMRIVGADPTGAAALCAARRVFERVEAACTRFHPDSPLMRANADRTSWHQVPEECYLAVEEAVRAHLETGGLFDPRVLDTLVALGYDRTLPFRSGAVAVAGSGARLRTGHPVASRPRPGTPIDPSRRGPHRPRRDRQGTGRPLGRQDTGRRRRLPPDRGRR